MPMPCALTIAGSDSSGGAGIQADLRTFAALHAYGTSAITALTAQNTRGVVDVHAAPSAHVVAQIDAVCDDMPVGAAKTGMLATAELIDAVAAALQRRAFPVVVDPVMISKSGHALLHDDAVDALVQRLLPRATLVTPNLPEAARLVGFPVVTLDDQGRAAARLLELGARAALVKGGHAIGDPVDVLVVPGAAVHLRGTRIDTRHTHGTGCTYSAAIAALLARGVPLVDSVRRAHAYVRQAILQAPGLGAGHGPLHHMHPFYAAGPDA